MKTILVPVEQHSTLPSVLETALLVGRSVVGYIEGFAVGPDLRNFIAVEVVLAPPILDETMQREMVATARERFETFMRKHAVPEARQEPNGLSFGWLGDTLKDDPFIGDYGRAFDLIIVGRPVSSRDGPRKAPAQVRQTVEAACPVTAAPPTTQCMAGSCPSRSASFTSSYPVKRPNTDWRNCPTRVWRPFAPVRVSVRTSPAVSLRPRASSSSRQASSPPSDVTFVPWNSSLRRRSNTRPRAPSCASPDVTSIRGTCHRPYRPDDLIPRPGDPNLL